MDGILSPQGHYQVQYGMNEVAMSHWIYAPYIYRSVDNALMFDLDFDGWSCDSAVWLSDSTVLLKTRRYPGRTYCNLTLELTTKTGEALLGSIVFPSKKILPPQPPVSFFGSFSEIKNWLRSR